MQNDKPTWLKKDCEPGLVSVIIPTYNRVNLLIEALNSIKRQTYRPIELLIIDDGSTDHTHIAVQNWTKDHVEEHMLVTRYLYQENQGAPSARNCGLILSRGEYIQFFDSDDILHPQKLEIHVAALRKNPQCDYAWSKNYLFSESIANIESYEIESLIGETRNAIYELNDDLTLIPWNTTSGLFRRDLCIRVGQWNETLKRWQDVEYVMRFGCLHPTCVSVDAVLYFVRNHSQGRIHDLYGQSKGIERGFHTLEAIEQVLINSNNQNRQVWRTITNFYLGIARLAMQLGDSDAFTKALCKVTQYRNEPVFKIKIGLLRLSYHLLQGKFSALLFNVYSNLLIRVTTMFRKHSSDFTSR